MKVPETPENEKERLAALRSYSILDSLPEQDYDNIVNIAAQICNMPISMVSLIDKDRQWFKAKIGLKTEQTDRDLAFCAHAINRPDEIMVIRDARQDDRFEENPLVEDDPTVVFYAGVPLKDSEGYALGTLCVIDTKPNDLTPDQAKSLRALSQQVMRLLELRRKTKNLEQALESLEDRNQQLDRFAMVAAHDLKSPLNNIRGFLDLLQNQFGGKLDAEAEEILNFVGESTDSLRSMVDGLLHFSQSEKLLEEESEEFRISRIEKHMLDIYSRGNKDVKLQFNSQIETLKVNRVALEQILRNLISNAIKYNDKPTAQIEVSVSEANGQYRFEIKDNGKGIAAENQDRIFEMFETESTIDRFGQKGTGIGLATVKRLIHKLGGEISLQSEIREGSTFSFWLPQEEE